MTVVAVAVTVAVAVALLTVTAVAARKTVDPPSTNRQPKVRPNEKRPRRDDVAFRIFWRSGRDSNPRPPA